MLQQKELRAPVNILLGVPLLLLVFGIYHGLLQTLYRAGIIQANSFLGIEYYQGLTAHGVINAVLLTTYFAIAFGYIVVDRCLKVPVVLGWVWTSLVLLVIGTLVAAYPIFSGQASVLYTFYPPLKAHPLFYMGLAVLVVASWFPLYIWVAAYLEWRAQNPTEKTPLPIVGIFVSFIVWQLCTLPVAVEVLFMLLPWSLGLVSEINVLLARTLFWFFGHPLVYFWLLPVYTAYYTVLPKVAGGKLYSDFAGRFVFLSFCVLSAPLGLHHQFADPGIASTYKGLHTVLTSFVAVPSVMTAFTIAASLEYASRKRGGKGLFGWWLKLPYFTAERWLFPYLFCGLVIFIFGGATGVVNASYNVNAVVHNTAWIPAHFHLTVGGPVFLGILGLSLFILVGINGRQLVNPKLAMAVPYMWTLGVMTMSSGQFVGSMMGEPRRTNMGLTYLNPASPQYRPEWHFSTMLAVVGGVLMTVTVLSYFWVLMRSMLVPAAAHEAIQELPLAEPYHDEDISFVQSFRPWIIAAIIAVVVAYTPPLLEIYRTPNIPQGAYDPHSPLKIP